MSTEAPHPRVGVAALIHNREGKFLTGKRIGSHGAGTLQLPGGHLEYGESFLACAERETLEETGLKVKALQHIATTNDIFETEKKHYITIFVSCQMVNESDQPQVGFVLQVVQVMDDLKKIRATEKSEEKLFLPLINLLAQEKTVEDLEVKV
ncbi:hypothetical protein ACKAV7_005583 [Fusarium commune]